MIAITLRIVIWSCWIIFLAYWWISARTVKAAAEKQSMAGRIAQRIPLTLAIFLLYWDFKSSNPLGRMVLPHTPAILIAAMVICVLGMLGAIWARRTLADNWSGLITFKKGHELIRTGPYRYARHPIYTSLLLMVLGTALAQGRTGSIAAFALFFVGCWIKIVQEERLLGRHFPEEYPAYCTQVKALIPFIF